jgi:hypothetical protein
MQFLDAKFKLDCPEQYGIETLDGLTVGRSSNRRTHLLATAVRITPALFPGLAETLDLAKKNLELDNEVDCFVTSQAENQAFCMTHQQDGRKSYSVVLSSAIVTLLNPEELLYVIGHEVGHFLCGHYRYPAQIGIQGMGRQLAALQLSRAAEISADRFGLLTCRKIDTACSAMIKTAAGLSEPNLQPDLASILEQFRDLANNQGLPDTIFSTHPVIPVRIRALLRFEGVFKIFLESGKIDRTTLDRIDGQIDRDFHRASGNVLSRMNDRNLEDIRMWGLVAIFVADDILSKDEQHIMKDVLGETKTAKILGFLRSLKSNLKQAVDQKLANACGKAETCSLHSRQSILKELRDLCETAGPTGEDEQKALMRIQHHLGL